MNITNITSVGALPNLPGPGNQTTPYKAFLNRLSEYLFEKMKLDKTNALLYGFEDVLYLHTGKNLYRLSDFHARADEYFYQFYDKIKEEIENNR